MAVPVQVVEGQQQFSALSLIEGLNVAAVANTMNKIAQFQAVVQRTLKEGHDFGVIPGTQKPTMLKPGAEKILMLMGPTSAYEVTESVRDYEQGFFAFTVTCKLSRNGYPITEGVGHCNTRERRYQGEKQDPYTLANTVLKMAKKRALVDASLTVASLSDIFTQDLEDMQIPHDQPSRQAQPRSAAPTNEPATEKQVQLIQRKAKSKGLQGPALAGWIASQTSGKSMDKLSKRDASALIDALDSYTPQADPAPLDDDPFFVPSDDDLPF